MTPWQRFQADLTRMKLDPMYANPLLRFTDTAFWTVFFYRVFTMGKGTSLHAAVRFPWERLVEFLLGNYIPGTAEIGGGLVIYHAHGIIINGRAVLGRDVTLYARTCIGSRFPGDAAPVLGDRVVVGTGACIFGPVKIPDGAVIPANAVVTPKNVAEVIRVPKACSP